MSKVTIRFEDDDHGGCIVHTEGLVSAGGSAAEQVAYQVLRLLADLEGIPWESVATAVSEGGGESN